MTMTNTVDSDIPVPNKRHLETKMADLFFDYIKKKDKKGIEEITSVTFVTEDDNQKYQYELREGVPTLVHINMKKRVLDGSYVKTMYDDEKEEFKPGIKKGINNLTQQVFGNDHTNISNGVAVLDTQSNGHNTEDTMSGKNLYDGFFSHSAAAKALTRYENDFFISRHLRTDNLCSRVIANLERKIMNLVEEFTSEYRRIENEFNLIPDDAIFDELLLKYQLSGEIESTVKSMSVENAKAYGTTRDHLNIMDKYIGLFDEQWCKFEMKEDKIVERMNDPDFKEGPYIFNKLSDAVVSNQQHKLLTSLRTINAISYLLQHPYTGFALNIKDLTENMIKEQIQKQKSELIAVNQ